MASCRWNSSLAIRCWGRLWAWRESGAWKITPPEALQLIRRGVDLLQISNSPYFCRCIFEATGIHISVIYDSKVDTTPELWKGVKSARRRPGIPIEASHLFRSNSLLKCVQLRILCTQFLIEFHVHNLWTFRLRFGNTCFLSETLSFSRNTDCVIEQHPSQVWTFSPCPTPCLQSHSLSPSSPTIHFFITPPHPSSLRSKHPLFPSSTRPFSYHTSCGSAWCSESHGESSKSPRPSGP